MNINIVFVIGAGPLLNSKSSIRDKIKHTIISDWQGPNLEDFFFPSNNLKKKTQHHLKVPPMRRDKINTLLMKQDFMVHEQQEPREKRERNIEIFWLNFYNLLSIGFINYN